MSFVKFDEREMRSAYAPVRMRTQIFWQWARLAAKEGRITPDGRRDATLYRDFEAQFIGPARDMILAQAASDHEFQKAAGTALAKLEAMQDWMPLVGQFELCGRQMFDLHDRLTEMLLQTELGECTLEELHTPYDAFYVRFGTHDEIKVPFDEGRFEYFDGAFVAVSAWDEVGGKRIKIAFSSVHEDGTGVMYPGYFFDLLPDEQALPVPEAIDSAMHRRLKAFAPEPGDDENVTALKLHFCAEIEDAASVVRQAATLLVNALFYLESIRSALPDGTPGRDTPPERHAQWLQSSNVRRQKLKSALTADGYAVVRLVGAEIEDHGAGPGPGRGTVRVHWRRGHWRWQRHGAGRIERKRIWIKPVLVGRYAHSPADELPGHRYVVPPSGAKH